MTYEMLEEFRNTTQGQMIAGIARQMANISRYHRVPRATERCPRCGRKFYHILYHLGVCEGHSEDDEPASEYNDLPLSRQ